jgi:predicted small secreted protein
MSDGSGDCLPSQLSISGGHLKTLLARLTSSAFVILAGCNRLAGAGKEIERGGEKVQDTAKDVQQRM